MDLRGVKITWLGHATFLLDTPEGKRIVVDPWVEGNPRCPRSFHALKADAILATHGHGDHIGDLVSLQDRAQATVVACFEITQWLQRRKGIAENQLVPMNRGGTAHLGHLGVWVGMTDARHSSSSIDEDGTITYLGEACGFTLRFSNGLKIYVAGDTCAFGDMSLIAELWQPDLAILPIGDHFTMGPRGAAVAARLLGARYLIPCHYGTFPVLTGTPEAFRAAVAEGGGDREVVTAKIGEALG